MLSIAHAAEEVGFDSLWVGDHLLYDLPTGLTRGPWEAWTSLAAVAVATSRVEIGPLVASTGFHAPAMLAKQAATVDAISNGRLIVGLGAGWNEREYRAFGFPYDHRVSPSRRPSASSDRCSERVGPTSTAPITRWRTACSIRGRSAPAVRRSCWGRSGPE